MVLFLNKFILVLILTIAVVTAADIPHLVPNRRNIPAGWSNRNYLDEFLYGFIEGTTKISLAGKLDCPWELYQIARVWINMFKDWTTWDQAWSDEMVINVRKQQLAVLFIDMETRCNYLATIPPLFGVKAIIDILYFRASYKARVLSETEK